jgi:DnaJ domain
MGAVALRQPLGDLYQELGVARDASRDEIAAAYRARAKELHPDTRPAEVDAADRFARVGTAYRVLSDPHERARYDASLPAPAPVPAPPPAPVPPRAPAPVATTVEPPKRPRLSRKGARWCAFGGTALIGLGLVVGTFVFSLQRHDGDLRAHGIATTAVVVPVNGERRLEFETREGSVVRATESVKSGEEQPPLGTKVRIHYDAHDPTTIVTDESHTGRNVTLWIVAVKFVLGGGVLLWFGARRLRRS